MKVKIISIGNSRGIRIPMTILEQYGIENEVDLEVGKDRIVLKPVRSKPREGWDKAFRLMHERKDDTLLLGETVDAELEDWEWK